MSTTLPTFTVVIPAYEGADLLDIAAPCELFHWFADKVKDKLTVSVTVATVRGKRIKTLAGLHLVPDASFATAPKPNLLWVPGGNVRSLKFLRSDPVYLGYLQQCAAEATYTCSVCEGALLLDAAGLLNGRRATTHWAFIPCLKANPKIKVVPGYPRFVVNKLRSAQGPRYVVTGGGISSGIDEGLELIRLIAGKKVAEYVQVTTQYFPKPPVNGKITPATSCPLDDVTPAKSA